MLRISRQKSIFYITRVSCLAAISVIVMLFEFPLPFFPMFYKLDISTYPVLIGTFAMGPIAGLTIQLIKDLVHLLISNSSMGVGQLADFLVGITYILPAGIIYRLFHTKKGAIAASITGTITASIVGTILNYLVFIPLFAIVFSAPISVFISQGAEISNNITNLFTLVIFATLPFNLLKFSIVSLLTILSYKKISPLFKIMRKDSI